MQRVRRRRRTQEIRGGQAEQWPGAQVMPRLTAQRSAPATETCGTMPLQAGRDDAAGGIVPNGPAGPGTGKCRLFRSPP